MFDNMVWACFFLGMVLVSQFVKFTIDYIFFKNLDICDCTPEII